MVLVEARTRHTRAVDAWLILASICGLVVLGATRSFDWHRYSRGHFTAEFAIRGHGLFLSRTPDGTWSKLRLGKRDCATVYPGDWGDAHPDRGVREPCSPQPSGSPASTIELDPPL
jgi:hypothetical protein